MMNFKNEPLLTGVPLVTVGITSYNYGQFITTALDSVWSQTYANIEVIIIDDCSKDNCDTLINNWIEQHNIQCNYIQHKNNIGITRTLNEIIQLAKGKYITFFATDDIMLPGRIEKQVAVLEACDESYAMCYANALTTDEKNNELGFYSNFDKEHNFYEGFILEKFLKKEIVLATPTTLMRRDVFAKIGLFDARVFIEDYNFFVRLLATYKVKYTAYPCIVYRQKRYSKSAIHELMKANNSELHFRDRIISNHSAIKFTSDKNIQRLLKKNIQKALNHLAYHNSRYYYKMLLLLLLDLQISIPLQSLSVKPKVFFNKWLYKN